MQMFRAKRIVEIAALRMRVRAYHASKPKQAGVVYLTDGHVSAGVHQSAIIEAAHFRVLASLRSSVTAQSSSIVRCRLSISNTCTETHGQVLDEVKRQARTNFPNHNLLLVTTTFVPYSDCAQVAVIGTPVRVHN